MKPRPFSCVRRNVRCAPTTLGFTLLGFSLGGLYQVSPHIVLGGLTPPVTTVYVVKKKKIIFLYI